MLYKSLLNRMLERSGPLSEFTLQDFEHLWPRWST